MPLVLTTETNPGTAEWVDSSILAASSPPLNVQLGSLTANNSGDLDPNGFIDSFAESAGGGTTRIFDAGGVGRDQSSTGLAANTTYITGGIGDSPGSATCIVTPARPLYEHRFRLDAGLADCRFFCGFSPAEDVGSASASDDPADNYFGLQFSPVSRSDTNFQIAGKSAGGGTQVLIDTGIVPATGNIYRLRIEGNSTTSFVATLFLDGDGTSDFTTTQLFTTTVTNTDAIPVTTGYTGNISMTSVNAVTVTFTHYYFAAALRAGVQVS